MAAIAALGTTLEPAARRLGMRPAAPGVRRWWDPLLVVWMAWIFDAVNNLGAVHQTIAEQNGAKDIYAFATHGVLVGPAIQNLKGSPVKKVIITDSIPLPPEKQIDKIEVLSVDKLFADAMWRIHENESVSKLFE